MDVSFTNITNRTTKSAYNPIEWSNIQVRTDGTFDTGDIHGIFYGPNHEEVGGTFNRRRRHRRLRRKEVGDSSGF